ncbi:FGGY-family carbohydrate kinase [Rhizobium grahamii]|uniref:Eryithritol kinase n=2 Tax=Rhizobium grahamii TaxID=1120045 RepID=S3HNV8_9HYPH|nr:FGGY-family carbohydrate kinase [Rhizobium grahamii]EPE95096.1 eryithritol kinase [Rhizobium grahamii CCGE 502]RDJ07049.1 carbohydrate kinase [Rhizobium grahamii]
MTMTDQIIIGIDAGTSVIKAVAFALSGKQIASASIRNAYMTGDDGSATQSLAQTWKDCVGAVRGLGEKVPGLASRTTAIAVTGQGDGTWLVGSGNEPVGDAWLWLDARAAPTVTALAARERNRARFEATGTGLNTCQQGAQMAHMQRHAPELLDRAEVALHCKDWLYLNLTGVRATDPSEASFTFGNFRTRRYDPVVIDALGLERRRALLPEIIEGTEITHGLTAEAATSCGLLPGTPVCLGYVDMVMTALGAGVRSSGRNAACSTIGSTGVHLRAKPVADVTLNAEGTGYVIALPVPGIVTQVQTNMGATINIDWILGLAGSLMSDAGKSVTHAELVARIDAWYDQSRPGSVLYHPYISEAGERGPFVNANARAGFSGLSVRHGFADLLRSVIEGLGLATRDCYAAMGNMPEELRITGGATRSTALRRSLSAAVNAPVRLSQREETGAAGVAMMAAVAVGVYQNMDDCITDWVTPLLGEAEVPQADDAARFDRLFSAYTGIRRAMPPAWDTLAGAAVTSPAQTEIR